MDVLDRFLSHVDQSGGPDACHPWTGPVRNGKGYGRFRVDGRNHVAHRWLLGHLRGKPLKWPDEVGCHTCDNPPCCNPAHLYVGSHAENARDAIERSGHGGAIQRAKTHCPQGHPYNDENTAFSGVHRYCRTCKRIQSNENAKRLRRARGLKGRTRLSNGRFASAVAQ